jgi:putative toxin-antitoxin system antitoxin component (TIGR02293 family)
MPGASPPHRAPGYRLPALQQQAEQRGLCKLPVEWWQIAKERPSDVGVTEGGMADFYSLLGGKLGVAKIQSGEDLAELVEKRLPAAAIQALIRGGLSDTEVYHLNVPRRTLAHRIARHQPLSKDESDKAVRVARITAMAERVFGEPERAWRWLRKPQRNFEGRTPVEMLATEAGARLVEEMLAQIDHGIFA